MSYFYKEFQNSEKLKDLFKDCKNSIDAFRIDFKNCLKLEYKEYNMQFEEKSLYSLLDQFIERLYLKDKSYIKALKIQIEEMQNFAKMINFKDRILSKMIKLRFKHLRNAIKDIDLYSFMQNKSFRDFREFEEIHISRFYDL